MQLQHRFNAALGRAQARPGSRKNRPGRDADIHVRPARAMRAPLTYRRSAAASHDDVFLFLEGPIVNNDHLKGAADQVSGKIKEQAGKLTGDTSREIGGKAQQLKGRIESKIGDVKDRADQTEERDEAPDSRGRTGA